MFEVVPLGAAPTGTVGSLSLAPLLEIVPQLEPYKATLAELEDQLKRAVIDSPDAFQRGSEYAGLCKQRGDQLEDLRTAIKGPIDDYATLVQSLFKPLLTRFDVCKKEMLSRMNTYQQAERAKQAAAAAAARKKAEEEALALAATVEASGDAAGAAAILDVATMATPPPVPSRMAVTNSFGQSTSSRGRWTGRVDKPMDVLKAIVDGKLPISLVSGFSQAEINRIAGTIKSKCTVNGLEIYEDQKLGLR